ncbi:matrix metalloproteinase-18 [Hydra vulgaris]|uniref:matrix metalloproteinase-18 n=1 Tax=Hydra vulgaris TaxID=6087 RepID=UPI001F5F0040|nr:matrix metalloproteinase-18 [Hydra vulgaris]
MEIYLVVKTLFFLNTVFFYSDSKPLTNVLTTTLKSLTETISTISNDEDEAKNYLIKFGYLTEEELEKHAEEPENVYTTNPLRKKKVAQKTIKEAIFDFQVFHNLPKTGILDSATLLKMRAPRCNTIEKKEDAHKLNVMLSKHGRLKKRSLGSFQKMSQSEMTWTLNDHKPDGKYLHLVNVLDLIEFGLNVWAKVTNIKFKRIQHRDFFQADIYFSFHTGDHGDGNSFDGPGGSLAHAINKEIHFDKSEPWQYNLKYSTLMKRPANAPDFVYTVIHEVGHVLGLSHSRKLTSVMHETIQIPFSKDDPYVLDDEDITKIKADYGQCWPNSIKSAFSDLRNGKTYFIVPPFSYQLNDAKLQVENGWPMLTKEIWGEDQIDEIFYHVDDRVYFFVKDRYHFSWYGTLSPSSAIGTDKNTGQVGWPGLPGTAIDAAFVHTDGKAYIFINDLVYRWDPNALTSSRNSYPKGAVESGWPKKSSEVFPGIPNKIDTAFRWYYNGKVYFFKDKYFWEWIEKDKKCDGPYGTHQWKNICDVMFCNQEPCKSWDAP